MDVGGGSGGTGGGVVSRGDGSMTSWLLSLVVAFSTGW